jgi:hypothetical protein
LWDRIFRIVAKIAKNACEFRPGIPLYELAAEWHREHVNALRQLRRDAHLSQQQCADLLVVPLNTVRMWDSGLRPTPCGVLERVDVAVRQQHTRDSELCSLDQLAREFSVHERTLRRQDSRSAESSRLSVGIWETATIAGVLEENRRVGDQARMRLFGSLTQGAAVVFVVLVAA